MLLWRVFVVAVGGEFCEKSVLAGIHMVCTDVCGAVLFPAQGQQGVQDH